ncbi:MAG TPA: universal stress protein [Polyangiaceae bacterium]|nr:universal stress protein [Polyangiaceae bacterium]
MTSSRKTELGKTAPGKMEPGKIDFRKILVPVDFSPPSFRAVRMAAELAHRFEGSVEIVHIFDPVAYPLPDGYYVMFTQPQLEQMFAQFDLGLAACKREALEAGAAQVDTHVRQGICAPEICSIASDGHFDLIVMGTHGRRGLEHLLLGSVAERVLRQAPCPVLTVRADGPRSPAADGAGEAGMARSG